MSAVRAHAPDEMFDSPADLAAPGRLGEFLTACHEKLIEPYRDADRRALRSQRRYRILILLAAVLTTLALFVDAGQLAFQKHLPEAVPISLLEVLLAAGSIGLVAAALSGGWQKDWLLRRFQAERYRLLKFRILGDPDLWTRKSAEWLAELDREAAEIAKLEHGDLEEEASHDEVAKLPSARVDEVDREDLARLLSYYERRRLTLQIDYFSRAARGSRSVWLNPLWVPLVFFASMAIVLLHFAVEHWAWLPKEGIEERGLAVLPILLPSLLAGLRLQVTANEVARNRNRSLAHRSALEEIARRLGSLDRKQLLKVTGTLRETREPPGLRVSRQVEGGLDPSYIFGHLALSEQILSSDQREWLRLMLEAEWYK
jgi:hypothetical protein